jgi:hypothetical protein
MDLTITGRGKLGWDTIGARAEWTLGVSASRTMSRLSTSVALD